HAGAFLLRYFKGCVSRSQWVAANLAAMTNYHHPILTQILYTTGRILFSVNRMPGTRKKVVSRERERKPTPQETAGLAEPGFDRFRSERKRLGHPTADTILQYAGILGKVRELSGKPLLELSVEEVEALDGKLRDLSSVHRVVLKMFFTTN